MTCNFSPVFHLHMPTNTVNVAVYLLLFKCMNPWFPTKSSSITSRVVYTYHDRMLMRGDDLKAISHFSTRVVKFKGVMNFGTSFTTVDAIPKCWHSFFSPWLILLCLIVMWPSFVNIMPQFKFPSSIVYLWMYSNKKWNVRHRRHRLCKCKPDC